MGLDLPLWRIALLFHLREDAFCLVILAVCACRHLPIAFDFFLPAHVASLSIMSASVVASPPHFWSHTLAIRLLFGSPCSLASPNSNAARSSANKLGGIALGGKGEPSAEKLLNTRRWLTRGDGLNIYAFAGSFGEAFMKFIVAIERPEAFGGGGDAVQSFDLVL